MDSTTNPSLILNALNNPDYHFLLDEVVQEMKQKKTEYKDNDELINDTFLSLVTHYF